jgi:hypothetical protein
MAALARMWDVARVLITGHATESGCWQAYVRARDLDALVDNFGLHAAPSRPDQSILLRPVIDPWPLAEHPAGALDLAQTATGLAEIQAWRQEYDRHGAFVSIGSLRFHGGPAEARAILQPYADLGLDLMIRGFTDAEPSPFLERVRAFGRDLVPGLSNPV